MAQVALMIDYENVHWSMVREYHLEPEVSNLINSLKKEAGKYGQVTITIAYADFDNEDFHGLQSQFQRSNVETRHVFSKTYENGRRKNAADIEMSLDALELSRDRGELEAFILVCGDRDFIPVVKRLQQKGVQVHIIGLRVTTSRDLQNFVGGKYTAIEDLLGLIPAKKSAPVPLGADEKISIETIICKLEAAQKRLSFVSVSHFLKNIVEGEFSEKSLTFNKAVEQELIELYKIPNPKDSDHPTKCCRLKKENLRVAEILVTNFHQAED
ncbi:MAG: NYN domain-containing protein [Rhabdochlamydiaceae bacterium]